MVVKLNIDHKKLKPVPIPYGYQVKLFTKIGYRYLHHMVVKLKLETSTYTIWLSSLIVH